MLANILYILAAVVPPCGAYVAHQLIRERVSAAANSTAVTRDALHIEHDKQKGMNEEQTQALLQNADAISDMQKRVQQLESLCEEQQTSLNRLADRNY